MISLCLLLFSFQDDLAVTLPQDRRIGVFASHIGGAKVPAFFAGLLGHRKEG